MRLQFTALAGGFQTTHSRGANRNYSPTTFFARTHLFANCLRDLHIFSMHLMLCNMLYPDWLKSTSSHMERNSCQLNSACLDEIQHGLVKMQPGSRSCYCSLA